MASYPKPIILETEGLLTNSAIPAFLSLTFAYSRGDTKVRFNSVDYNFIPHSGESYFLSQMPYEIGFYYALTGDDLGTYDLTKLGLLKGVSRYEDNEEKLKIFSESESGF